MRQLRIYLPAIILYLASGECLASSPSTAAPYFDPYDYHIQVFTIVSLAVAFVALLVVYWFRSRDPENPRLDHIGALIFVSWCFHNHWSNMAGKYAGLRPSYDMIAAPLGAGFFLALLIDYARWWKSHRPVRPYMSILLVCLVAAVVNIIWQGWKDALTYTPAFRCGMAGMTLVGVVLSQYLFFSKKDDENSQTDGRSDELSDERGTSPIV